MKDIPFRTYVFAAIGLNIFVLLAVAALQRFLPPVVPLFYGLPQSEDQLVNSWGLTIPSLVSIIVILVNTSIAKLIKDEFLRKILILGSFMVTIFSVVTTLRIIFMVGIF